MGHILSLIDWSDINIEQALNDARLHCRLADLGETA